MSAYNPPEKNLAIFDPSVFNDAGSGSGGLTQAEADARYLRFPNAQGTEDLLAVNVNGLATFNNNVVIQDASSNSATMSIDPSGSLNISGSSGIIKINDQLHSASTTGTDRQVFSSYYNFYDSATSTLDLKGRIFSSGNTCFFGMNLVDNSTLSFLIRSGGVNYTPLSLTRNATFNSNIIQSNLANIISQDGIIADLSSNIFKRSEIKTNFAGASNSQALDMYENTSGRGFRFVSDASGNGSYNDLTISRDSVLVSRFRPTSSTLGLVVGLNDAGGTGVRLSSATSTKGRVQIQAGTTTNVNLYDDSDATNPNSMIITTGASTYNINASSVSSSVPYINTFTGSFASNNIGYNASVNSTVFTQTSTPTSWPPNTSPLFNYLSITLSHPGTYILFLTVYFYNTSTTSVCGLSQYNLGLSTGTTLSNTGVLASSVIKNRTAGNLGVASAGPPFALGANGSIQLTSSCVYRATTTTAINFLGWADYSQGTFNAQVNIAYVKVA